MIERKHKIIDRRFQLGLITRVIVISIGGFALVITFLIVSAILTNMGIFKSLEDLNGAIQVQNNIVGSFVEFARLVEDSNLVLAANKIMADHERSIGVIRYYLEVLRKAALRNLLFLIFIIFVMIVQGVWYYLFLLRRTHRISGPVFVMNRHIDTVMQGKDPGARALRDRDEFKGLHENVVRLGSAYLKEREKNKKLRSKMREKGKR